MQGLVKKFLGFSIGPIASMLIGFISVPLTTYFIVPTEVGKASLFSMIQSIMVMIMYLGLDQSYVREYYDEKDKSKLISNCMAIPLFFSIMTIFICVVFYKPISLWLFGDIYFYPIILLGISTIFMCLERFIMLTLRMKEKAVLYSTISIITKLTSVIILLIFVLFIRIDFLAIIYSSIFTQILSGMTLFLLYRKSIKLKISKFSFEYSKSLLKYGLPLAGVAIVGYLLNSIDNVFLKMFSTYEEIGYYSVAVRITGFLAVLQNIFGTFWAPVSYRWYHENKPIYYYERVSKLLAFAMSLLFCIILLFKNLVPILISQTYLSSVTVLPFLLFHPIMYTLGITTELGMQFKKKSYYSLYISIAALFINIVLNMLLVPLLGAKGAAMTTGISYIVFFLLKTIVSRQLWERFEIKYYFVLISILFVSASVNTFIKSNSIVLLVNFLSIISILVLFNQQIRYIFMKIRYR